MHRNEFVRTSFAPAMHHNNAYQYQQHQQQQQQQHHQQQQLFHRNYLVSHKGRPEIVLGQIRRHSLDTQPDYPNYEKFINPVSYIQEPRLLRRDDGSISSLLSSDFIINDRTDVGPLLYHGQNYIYADNVIGNVAPPEPEIINRERVVQNLTAVGRFLEIVQKWPLPRLTFTTACLCFLVAIFLSPKTCAQTFLFPAFRLSFGTLYPAYASYKAVRTRNVKEYVKWMMYWIVYAFFTCFETFTDIFLSWFPCYYEIKVVIVIWLLSPATRGSSTLYRKFVHPMLTRREQEIDEYINQAKERGYSAVLQLGSKGVNYATNVIMQTAIKGGGNLVQTFKRSYSLSDLSEPDIYRTEDEVDQIVATKPQQRLLRPRVQAAAGRSVSSSRHSTGMYFSEVDVTKSPGDFNYNIRSSEDISSGYSSAEPVPIALSRTSSMTNATKARFKAKRTEMNDLEMPFSLMDQTYYPNMFIPVSVLNDSMDDGGNLNYDLSQSHEKSDESAAIACDPAKGEREESVVEVRPVKPEENKLLANGMGAVGLTTSDDLKDIETDADDADDEEDEFLDTISSTSLEYEEPASVEPTIEEHETVESPPVIPQPTLRELRDTLEEIKDSFRATIDPQSRQLQPTTIEVDVDSDRSKLRRPLSHNKGKAPPPPPPPPPPADTAISSPMMGSTSQNSSMTSLNKSIFKNLKSNLFRHHSSAADKNQKDTEKKSIIFGRETEI